MNYLAILVAAIAYMALGALWYSSALFGKAWMRGIGKTKEQIEKDFSPVNYVWGIITAFLASYAIARITYWSGGDSLADTIKVSVLAGVCFVFTTIWINDVFEKRPKGLTIINILYHIIGFIVVGIIIGIWR